jgi:DNA helicase-4
MNATNKIDLVKRFKYKYIFIDEYQDTSFIRYQLIHKLSTKFGTKVICVGDDFQSIYKFNGCDLDLFINFRRYFSNSKILKLKYTYRNPSDIVNISSRFVMKNRRQLRKRLIPTSYINNSLNVVYYKDIDDAYYKIIENIDNIMVLGRNNSDIDMINSGDLSYKDKSIRYYTVHKSKGLEEDYVIVINLIDNYVGFPSKIKENSIFYYIKKKEEYEFEEERRLFYVAITRCRKKTFLFTIKGRESIFVKELLKDYKGKINIFNFG